MSILRRYRIDPNDPGKALTRSVDVTPAWWRGGPDTFVDGADVLRAIERLVRDVTPRAELVCETAEIRIGMNSVSLVIVLREDMLDAEIETGRLEIVATLDALADGHPRRQATLRDRAEFAAERAAARTSTDLITTAPAGA